MSFIKHTAFPYFHLTTTKNNGDMKDEAIKLQFLNNVKILSHDLILTKQIHSNKVEIVSKTHRGSFINDCDGLITNDKSLFLGIFTADCMPILISSKNCEVKAAIHSGWKGLADEIIENAVGIFSKHFHINPNELSVYIGPHIQNCCYEVGKEFEDVFKVNLKNNKLDLSEIAISKLQNLKVKNIAVSPYCTKCSDLFFSYRKDKTSKRMLTII
jgi:YfiH family protein